MGHSTIQQNDLEESVETVIAGYQRKGAVISDQEKKIIAYHEIGHALVAARQKHSAPVTKITIIPRTSGALGYTMQVEEDERVLMSKEDAMNQLITLTGGRTAEELIFHSITSGASNDIEKATRLARAMVTRYGMSEKIGTIFLDSEQEVFLGNSFAQNRDFSEETAAAVDHEVRDLLRSCYELAMNTLKEHQDKLEGLAQLLIEKETLSREDFMAFIDGVPADAQPEETGKTEEPETSPEETQA
jgi:cell division protease FtsH